MQGVRAAKKAAEEAKKQRLRQQRANAKLASAANPAQSSDAAMEIADGPSDAERARKAYSSEG